MNEYFASIDINLTEGIPEGVDESPRGHSGPRWNSEISEFLGRKIPNAILPFSCIFNHNSPGAKYFEAKRVQAV